MRRYAGAARGVIVRWVRSAGLPVLTVAVGGTVSLPRALRAQDTDDGRSPAFLVASAMPSQPPTPVDISRTPVLRRRISLTLSGVTATEALRAIERQSGLEFAYSKTAAPKLNRSVRLDAHDITVAAALTEVLLDAGLDVVLAPRGTRVMLIPRGDFIRVGTVSGLVTAKEGGAALKGASVTLALPNTLLRTVTSDSGTFRFADVPAGEHAITVRYIGYRPLTKKVAVDSTPVRVVFALEVQPTKLNELVTTATGQRRRRDIGNEVTTIRADSVMQHAVIRNLTDLLDKRVPGLTVQHTSGAPGDPAKVRLRGLGSALRSNDPVVVIDGVRIYGAQSAASSGNLTNGLTNAPPLPAPSPLDQIDPNIIEKIEVFKGPSAATLYGADAANGVIVVTTKRGKPGPTRWNASLTYGRTDQPGRYPTGYYRWGHDVFTGVSRFCTLLDTRCAADSLVQFQALNVPDLTVLGTGQRTALSLTASGGSQALTYSVTGSYANDIGPLRLPDFEVARFQSLYQRATPDWMRQPHGYKDWSVTSNVTARLSSAAEVTLSSSLLRSEQRRTSLEEQLGSLQSTYIDTLNQFYYRPARSNASGGQSYILNPTADILRDYYRRTTASTITFTTGLNANWHPRPWFNATGTAGLNVVPRDDQSLLEGGLLSAADSGTLARGSGRRVVSTLDLQGALIKGLGHGFLFRTTVGANFTSTTASDLGSSAGKIPPGTSGFIGATGFLATSDRVSTSVFGWYIEPTITGQRFSLSTGLRLDGGSAYGTKISRIGGGGGFLGGLLPLPKLNGAWVISEEPWFPFKVLFSSLKLRGAYGQAQVQPGAGDRLRLYDQSVLLTTLGNTELRPERSTELEGGFEADMFDSRLSLEVTGYRRLQVDALMNVGVPGSVNGGGSVLKNIGNIRNQGLNATLGFTPLRARELTWSTQLTYNRNNNTLLKLGRGVDPNPEAGLVAGYPVGSRWAYPIVGFADVNGDNVVQAEEIRMGDSLAYMGRLMPAYMLVLNTNVVLFGGAVGITAGASYDAGMTQVNNLAYNNWVLSRALVDPSAPLSQQAAVVVADRPVGNGNSSLYGLMQEVATWRFDELSVRYRAPTQVIHLLGAQDLSIALQGRNLGLHSNYRGKDPDVNAWAPGEYVSDGGQLPQSRTWQLSVFFSY